MAESIWLRNSSKFLPKKSTDRREEFLLEMYRQCSNHLDRHILVTWQSVGVLAGALAVFVLGDKLDPNTDVRFDFVIGIVVLLCAWLFAHVYDASNWFDRNLHIITNIERQFLKPSDSREIHYYFLAHRPQRDSSNKKPDVVSPKLLKLFQIQLIMAAALWILVLAYHFYQRVYPGFHLSLDYFQAARSIPYVMTAFCLSYCIYVAQHHRNDYKKLLIKSPGKEP